MAIFATSNWPFFSTTTLMPFAMRNKITGCAQAGGDILALQRRRQKNQDGYLLRSGAATLRGLY